MEIPISALPPATAVFGSDLIPVVQSGVTKKATVSLLPAGSGGGSGSSGPNDTLIYNAAAHGITPAQSDIGPSVNSLITTLNLAGGGVIAFPPGLYNVGTTINLKGGVYLISLAPNHGYIAASPSSQSVKFSQNSGMTGWMIDTPNGGWSMGLQGIDLSGNGNNASGGIRFQGVYWGAIKQSMANGFGLSGFRQEQGSQGNAGFACVFEDLMTTNCVNNTISSVVGAFDVDGTDHYISRCEFACRALSSGLATSNKYVVACVIRGSNHFVDTVVAETSDKGFYITGTKSRFSNLRADTNNGDGFHVIGGANSFTNCDAIGNSQAATNTHDDFIVDNAAWGSYFTSCHSRLAGSINPRYGFNIQTNIQEPVYAGGYMNCSCESAGTARWYFPNGTVAGVQFAPFTIKPSSGSSIDVHETSGVVDLSNFTGATTITNMTGGVQGQTVRLLGNANVTVANNTTIKTNTAANLTLVANKLYPFTYVNGVWVGDS